MQGAKRCKSLAVLDLRMVAMAVTAVAVLDLAGRGSI
jgi:hypothetical protein